MPVWFGQWGRRCGILTIFIGQINIHQSSINIHQSSINHPLIIHQTSINHPSTSINHPGLSPQKKKNTLQYQVGPARLALERHRETLQLLFCGHGCALPARAERRCRGGCSWLLHWLPVLLACSLGTRPWRQWRRRCRTRWAWPTACPLLNCRQPIAHALPNRLYAQEVVWGCARTVRCGLERNVPLEQQRCSRWPPAVTLSSKNPRSRLPCSNNLT